jgi:fibronectin type 3 domain-containing protein
MNLMKLMLSPFANLPRGSRAAILTIVPLMVSSSVWAQIQINACDLNADGVVNSADVTLAVNMVIGLSACTADIVGIDTCNVVVVQRVINAIPPGTCLAGNPHTVTLSWTASTTPNVSYNIYRSAKSNGTYTKIGSVGVGVLGYVDSTALAGETYFYVATAVDSSKNESAYSAPPVQATVLFP